mgnify:CR=1 FL=1
MKNLKRYNESLSSLSYDDAVMKHLKKFNEVIWCEDTEYISESLSFKISSLNKNDLMDLMDFKWKIFGDVYMSNNNNDYDKSYKQMYDFTNKNTNFDISIKIKFENKIIGIYCFDIKCVVDYLESKSSSEISYKEDIQKYKGINGLQCLTLAVDPDYRELGIGKMLINESYKVAKNNGCKYLFGAAFSKLNNINHWLKRRRIVATIQDIGEFDFYYVTLADL